jgi:predicted dehydrogenase
MLKTAIIGYGNIGRKHAQVISESDRFQLSAIIDPLTPYNLPEGCPCYSSIEEMVESGTSADILAICTPNGAHAQQAIRGLESGMHVLVEKPMALTKKSAESVLHTAFNTGKKVFCVMQLRYSPLAIWLKQIIDQKLLGDLNLIEIRCYWNRNEDYYEPDYQGSEWRGKINLDGGPLFTQFSHFVDLIYWLLGEWRVHAAQFNNFSHKINTEFEDTGSIQFRLGETMGSFLYTTATFDKNYESTITLLGSKGTVEIGGQYFDNVIYSNPDKLAPSQSEIERYVGDRLYGHKMIYDNVDSVLSSGNSITTNALDGMKVVEMIESVYKFRKYV